MVVIFMLPRHGGKLNVNPIWYVLFNINVINRIIHFTLPKIWLSYLEANKCAVRCGNSTEGMSKPIVIISCFYFLNFFVIYKLNRLLRGPTMFSTSFWFGRSNRLQQPDSGQNFPWLMHHFSFQKMLTPTCQLLVQTASKTSCRYF